MSGPSCRQTAFKGGSGVTCGTARMGILRHQSVTTSLAGSALEYRGTLLWGLLGVGMHHEAQNCRQTTSRERAQVPQNPVVGRTALGIGLAPGAQASPAVLIDQVSWTGAGLLQARGPLWQQASGAGAAFRVGWEPPEARGVVIVCWVMSTTLAKGSPERSGSMVVAWFQ